MYKEQIHIEAEALILIGSTSACRQMVNAALDEFESSRQLEWMKDYELPHGNMVRVGCKRNGLGVMVAVVPSPLHVKAALDRKRWRKTTGLSE
jgi:hypothetical protein